MCTFEATETNCEVMLVAERERESEQERESDVTRNKYILKLTHTYPFLFPVLKEKVTCNDPYHQERVIVIDVSSVMILD